MTIPNEAVEAAGGVLVYHQRRDITSCMCGWSELGQSHSAHQAQLALEAAAPHMHDKAAETRLLAMVWTEAYQAGIQDGAGFGPTPNPYRSQA